MLRHTRLHNVIPHRPFTTSDRVVMAAQPSPPGMSRLERLPDELKLRVGYYLVSLAAPRVPTVEMTADDLIDYIRSNEVRQVNVFRPQNGSGLSDACRVLGNGHDYNDSLLALASTSTRLCGVFLVEHGKHYGLQNTLFRSIELGNMDLIQHAVDYGADINKEGSMPPWDLTPLQLAVKTEQLPVILYLLRRGVDKADELVMDVLQCGEYRGFESNMTFREFTVFKKCLCNLLPALMEATLGGNQTTATSSQSEPNLPHQVQQALVPTGRHLWFILRTCMSGDWMCSCTCTAPLDCPMELISLLRRYGAKWMPCEPFEEPPEETAPADHLDWNSGWRRIQAYLRAEPRGLKDLERLTAAVPESPLPPDPSNPKLFKPSVAGAMDESLLEDPAYRRDHCIPFLVAMLEHGVAAEQGDLSAVMALARNPDTRQLSVAAVLALLRAGADANEPGAMAAAMRLACMGDTRDAAVAFVTLLLEHGADPGAAGLRGEVQVAAEKWWVQSGWQSSAAFCRILWLLVRGGLDERVACEIAAVLGLDRDLLGEESCSSTEG